MAFAGLTKGSPRPAAVSGKWRLYGRPASVQTEKIQILLSVLDIPHDIVLISYDGTPEWYTDVQAEGKIPALDTGSEVIAELGPIIRHLLTKYPDSKYADNEHRDANRAIGEKIHKVDESLRTALVSRKSEDVDSYYKDVEELMKAFVSELKKRGTPYLRGDSPGIIDFLVWPTLERMKILARVYDKELPSSAAEGDVSLVRKWRDGVTQVKAVKDAQIDVEQFVKVLKEQLKK